MSLTATKRESDFEMTPAGAFVARCYRVIDLGTQKTEYMGQSKRAPKVMLAWELIGAKPMADGRPFSISKRYTVSTHEKSTLAKDLQAWRGRAFTAEEARAFNIGNVLGAYCLINVTHNTGGDGNVYANVTSIMPVPKGMPKPAAVNQNQVFDIDNPDMELFNSFSDKLKATIMQAEEWNKRNKKSTVDDGRGYTSADDIESDIPWSDDDMRKAQGLASAEENEVPF